MDPRRSLLDELEAGLRLCASVSPQLTTESHASDLFEAYVFTIILRAARDLGAEIDYRDVTGGRPASFVFRTSPGYMYSKERQYCHAVIAFQGKPQLEAHVGIRVEGASGVLHECDIAVLEQVEAATCRQNEVQPRQGKVVIAVECKFYSVPIPLGLARGFVGLTSDLASRYHRFFVVNTGSGQAEKYLTARKRLWERNVYPGAVEDVERLKHAFQTSFRDFYAAN